MAYADSSCGLSLALCIIVRTNGNCVVLVEVCRALIIHNLRDLKCTQMHCGRSSARDYRRD